MYFLAIRERGEREREREREREMLTDLGKVSKESDCHPWPIFIPFGKGPCDHNHPIHYIQ